jgi:hypothetical protein
VSAAVTPICYDFSSFAGSLGVRDVINAADAPVTFHEFQWPTGLDCRWCRQRRHLMVRVPPDPSASSSYRYADQGDNVAIERFGVGVRSSISTTSVTGKRSAWPAASKATPHAVVIAMAARWMNSVVSATVP